MFQIGEFSRMARVTIETLRHYDAIGLLKPAKVDSKTGYRYYNAGQLVTLNRILALKEAGLSLDEIKRILGENLSVDEVRGLLKGQLVQVESVIDEAEHQRQRLLSRLKSLEQDDGLPAYEVSLKSTEAFVVASIRETITTVEQIPERWNQLFTMIAGWMKANALSIGIPLALYHDEAYRTENVDTECAFIIRDTPPDKTPDPSAPIVIRQMAAMPQVATIVVANFDVKAGGLTDAYTRMGQWIAQNDYHIVDAPRELYYGSPQTGDFTAEIQFPVDKCLPE